MQIVFQKKCNNVSNSDLHFYVGDTTDNYAPCGAVLVAMLSHYIQVYLDGCLEEKMWNGGV